MDDFAKSRLRKLTKSKKSPAADKDVALKYWLLRVWRVNFVIKKF